MVGYIIRRLVSAFLVVVVTSMIVFAIFFLGPSDPAAVICNQNGRCTPERQALLNHALGFDQSVVKQYGIWAKGLFVDRTIDMGATYECAAPCLGISFATKSEVRKDLTEKYPATLSLAIGGAAIYLFLGVSIGVLSARRRGTFADRALVSSTLFVSSIPYYLAAFLAWLYLINEWGVFSDSSYTPLTENPAQWFSGLLLPWLVIGVFYSTQYARFSRGAMVETLSEDYVRTATAKGAPQRTVTVKHALRAAIVPIVTIFGLDFAGLLAGTVFTEYIFGIDGIGRWGLQAINTFDFPVVAATVLVGSVLVVLANLVVDIAYSFLDPRVRLV
jgi:peptide/nickel transport system permease protein